MDIQLLILPAMIGKFDIWSMAICHSTKLWQLRGESSFCIMVKKQEWCVSTKNMVVHFVLQLPSKVYNMMYIIYSLYHIISHSHTYTWLATSLSLSLTKTSYFHQMTHFGWWSSKPSLHWSSLQDSKVCTHAGWRSGKQLYMCIVIFEKKKNKWINKK